MLKKLDFYLTSFNSNTSNISLVEYEQNISYFINTPILFNYDSNLPIFIHLLDNKGYVIYFKILPLDYNCSRDSHYLKDSLNQICVNIKEFNKNHYLINGELNFMIFISQKYTPYVDVKCSNESMKNSLNELIKMHRDITWFD